MTAMIASNREQMVLPINTTIRTYFAEGVHSKDALEFCIFRKILPVFCCHVYFIGLLVNRKRKYPWRPILLYLRFDNIHSNAQYLSFAFRAGFHQIISFMPSKLYFTIFRYWKKSYVPTLKRWHQQHRFIVPQTDPTNVISITKFPLNE